MTVYAVLDCVTRGGARRQRGHEAGNGGAGAHQLVVIGRVLAPGPRELALLALEAPPLHLLVGHELDRAVADAEEREGRAAVEPREALRAVYRREAVCAGAAAVSACKAKRGRRGQAGRRGRASDLRQRLRYAAGSPAVVVNMRTLTTQIGFVMIAVTAPGGAARAGQRDARAEGGEGRADSLVLNRAGTPPRRACSRGRRPRHAA